jgi:hypothetical protein
MMVHNLLFAAIVYIGVGPVAGVKQSWLIFLLWIPA